MREHDALGIAGRARGVDDRRHVVRGRHAAPGRATRASAPLPPGPDASSLRIDMTSGASSPSSKAMTWRRPGRLARIGPDLRELRGVRHAEDRDARVAEQELDLVRRERRVDRHVDAAGREGRKVGVGPLRPVLREDAHPVARAARRARASPRLRAHTQSAISRALMSVQAPSRRARSSTARSRNRSIESKNNSFSVVGALTRGVTGAKRTRKCWPDPGTVPPPGRRHGDPHHRGVRRRLTRRGGATWPPGEGAVGAGNEVLGQLALGNSMVRSARSAKTGRDDLEGDPALVGRARAGRRPRPARSIAGDVPSPAGP